MKINFSLVLITVLFFAALAACSKQDSREKGAQAGSDTLPGPSQLVELDSPNIQTGGSDTGDPMAAPYSQESFAEYYNERKLPAAFNFNQDLNSKSLEELRLLRSAILARRGYLFKDAILRGFFNGKPWYQPPFWEENYPIKLSQKEIDFIAKVRKLEQEKMQQNYLSQNGSRVANLANLVNRSQFKQLPKPLLDKLSQNGFAIVPGDNLQLFHVYEKNDYELIPSFVTTDLYLQLFHMYFVSALRTLEKEKFIPILTELLEGLYNESMDLARSSSDASLKATAEFNAVYYAVPLYFLEGQKKEIPASYRQHFEDEISNISSASGNMSMLLETDRFNYSLFKPRGHYSRSDQMKNYFRAMMWVQTAFFCRDNEQQLRRISLSAWLLANKKSAQGKELVSLYRQIYEATTFLIGESDNYSAMDMVNIFKKEKLANTPQAAIQSDNLKKISAALQKLKRNRIKPKVVLSCEDKINLMPQRYLPDNEIMQELVDAQQGSKRMLPRGLDVFAAFGDASAKNILLNEYKEGQSWPEYPARLQKMEQQFASFQEWDKTVYNKWIQGLTALNKPEATYPPFMQTAAWQKKNLNTALASWSELKHDALLYGEQPNAAECGGYQPPPPVTVGYVEPNIHFWKRCLELIQLTSDKLSNNQLFTEQITGQLNQLREMAQFLLRISEKELRKQTLSAQEYETIRLIGSTAEYFTISTLESPVYRWEEVEGPEKSVAVIADVYTFNIAPYNTALQVGIGKVNDIYVVVEINGLLYLTKGAVFSYYEFGQDASQRLTDEEWQQMLEKGKAPGIPMWIKEIIAPVKPLEVQEGYFYSSGC